MVLAGIGVGLVSRYDSSPKQRLKSCYCNSIATINRKAPAFLRGLFQFGAVYGYLLTEQNNPMSYWNRQYQYAENYRENSKSLKRLPKFRVSQFRRHIFRK